MSRIKWLVVRLQPEERQPAEPGLHPAHHDADAKALQNTSQFTAVCRTRTGRGKRMHGTRSLHIGVPVQALDI
ncbi:hypothetical protein JHN63_46285 [Streptomyces sp. MBT65]|uniref:hypothetical protein n=1 Tax=Streptomyces sp. MBT65 TaxID=1488395 RepID=UPI00190D8031|nr:hypothetical protein [Streptomyces sp. MBT65]MBK3581060.1 hypothetical protein [Streptomyces sp. MBT65]